ncbi:MAG: ATP-binding protein [Candidatus Nitrosothermus koennekii]|nr:MAG: ATP-binding protein [Candidatus Nitrosothermus koennekii]
MFNNDTITNYQSALEARKIANNNTRDKSRLASINVLGLINGFLNNKKVMPSLPPDPGTEIYEADKERLKNIFAKDTKEWIKLGKLLRESSIDVYVNINKVASRHLAILATTGSGKSNLLALLMKRISELNGTLVIFDYHGEYSSLELNNIIHAMPKINPRDLDSEEFADMIEIRENAERQRALLNEAFRHAKNEEDFWKALLDWIRLAKNDNNKKKIAVRLEEIVERASNSMKNILDADISRSLDQIQEHKINIFNMLELNEKQASIIISYYLKEILNDRKLSKKRISRFSSPVIVAIEEAHAFIPEDFRSRASDIVAKVAREGRKFGVGLIIISQRPSKIDQNVLSQMNSLAVSRIIQPKDQRYIIDVTEHIPDELLEHLPSLNTGEMLLTGEWITIPSLVKIDEVKEKLVGSDIDAVKEWNNNIREMEKGEKTEDLIMLE